ncbi:hypothetical protein D6774_01290 [Candidatus Woesearchaeota archaeon]|nr:MAG: hypothetical protein D6774_01290 [Candidatus Woesearchaeota archaeon]
MKDETKKNTINYENPQPEVHNNPVAQEYTAKQYQPLNDHNTHTANTQKPTSQRTDTLITDAPKTDAPKTNTPITNTSPTYTPLNNTQRTHTQEKTTQSARYGATAQEHAYQEQTYKHTPDVDNISFEEVKQIYGAHAQTMHPQALPSNPFETAEIQEGQFAKWYARAGKTIVSKLRPLIPESIYSRTLSAYQNHALAQFAIQTKEQLEQATKKAQQDEQRILEQLEQAENAFFKIYAEKEKLRHYTRIVIRDYRRAEEHLRQREAEYEQNPREDILKDVLALKRKKRLAHTRIKTHAAAIERLNQTERVYRQQLLLADRCHDYSLERESGALIYQETYLATQEIKDMQGRLEIEDNSPDAYKNIDIAIRANNGHIEKGYRTLEEKIANNQVINPPELRFSQTTDVRSLDLDIEALISQLEDDL